MAKKGALEIVAGLDTEEFKKGLDKLEPMATKAGKAVVKAIAAAAAALAGLGTAAVTAGMTFESAFAGVRKTVDATEAQFKEMSDALRAMSLEMPQSAAELAGIAEAAGQLGIAQADVVGFTKIMAQLGDSTNLTSVEAATMLARFGNIMGVANVGDYERLGSTIVALGNNMATTEAEIVAMSQRMAGAGKQAGMTSSEVMAFAATFSSLGIEAEAGGTAFQRIVSEMTLSVAKGGKKLEQFANVSGMTVEQFKESWKNDASGTLQTFIKNLKTGGDDAIAILDEMGLADIRLSRALLSASEGAETMDKAVRIASKGWSENTALATEAGRRYDTTASKMAMLKNSAVDLGISFFEDVRNPIRGVIDEAGKMMDALKKAFAADGLAGLTSALGGVIAEIISHFAKAAPKLIEEGARALKGFITGLVQNKGEILSAAQKIIQAFGEGIASLLPKTAGDVVKSLTSALSAAVQPMAKLAEGALKLLNKISPLIPSMLAVVAALKGWETFSKMSTLLKTASKGMASLATATTTTTNLQIQGVAAQRVYTAAQQAGAVATGLATKATQALSSAFKANPIGLIITGLSLLVPLVIQFADKLGIGKKEMSESAKEAQRLAEKTDELSDSFKTLRDSQKEQALDLAASAEMSRSLADEVQYLMDVENKSATQKEILKAKIAELNELLPDMNLAYDEASDKIYDANNQFDEQGNLIAITSAELDKQVESLQANAKAEAARQMLIDTYKEKYKLEKQRNELLAEQEERINAVAAANEKIAQAKALQSPEMLSEANAELAVAEEELASINSDLEQIDKNINTADEDMARFSRDAIPGAVDSFETLESKASEWGVGISRGVADGIKAGSYMIPQSKEELIALADFDELVVKAKAAGVEVPEKIATGIQSGMMSPAQAAAEMQAQLDFQNLINNSGLAGDKSMIALADAIKAGDKLPAEALAEANALAGGALQKLADEGTKAGDSTIAELVAAVQRGEMLPAEALAQANAYIKGELNTLPEAAGQTGADLDTKLAGSISANSEAPAAEAQAMVDKAKTNLDTLSQAGAQTGTDTTSFLAETLAAGGESVSAAAVQMTDPAIVALQALADDGAAKGDATIANLAAAVKRGEMAPAQALALARKHSADELSKMATESGAAGDKAKTNLVSGLDPIKSLLPASAAFAVEGARAAMNQDWSPLGDALGSGANRGLSAWSSKLATTAANMVAAAKAAAEKKAGIHSPSALWRDDIGKMLAAGAAEGIEEGSEDVAAAATALMEDAAEAMDKPLEIAPVDLEALRRSLESLGPELPKLAAEISATALAHFDTLTGTAAAQATAWEDPLFGKTIVLKADITAEIDGEKASRILARPMDIALACLDPRKGAIA